MSKLRWVFLFAAVLMIGGVSWLLLSGWLDDHYTHFDDTEQISFQDNTMTLWFSKNSCLGRVAKQDLYSTSLDRDDVWDVLYSIWEPRSGDWILYREEANYVAASHPIAQFKSKIAFDSYPHQYSVWVTNEVAVQFPKQLCMARKRIIQLGR
ncbi:MAG: hypothetical protein AAGD96_10795 [Chloroflexota bacterium]